jgi:3-oxoacid CoA-transferase subunit A
VSAAVDVAAAKVEAQAAIAQAAAGSEVPAPLKNTKGA